MAFFRPQYVVIWGLYVVCKKDEKNVKKTLDRSVLCVIIIMYL